MSKHDWYRQTTWNEEIEAAFQARFKRSRGDFSKVQYLRIQGLSLISSTDVTVQETGVYFLNRVIDEYPSFTDQVNLAVEELGDYYSQTAQWEKAEYYFGKILNQKKKDGISDTLDFKFAENLLNSDDPSRLEEVYKVISVINVEELTFNSEKFYALKILALLCQRLCKKEEAVSYAAKALKISKITTPYFSRHPTIGIPHPTQNEITQLHSILE